MVSQQRPADNLPDEPVPSDAPTDGQPGDEGQPRQDQPPQADLLRYVGMGTEFFLTFAIFLGAGLLLDLHLGTLPGLTIAGAAVGFALAMYRLVSQARQINRRAQARPGETGQRPGEPSS